MGKKIFITHLDLPKYIGICECRTPDVYGFRRKECRIDYFGCCDIGTQQVEMFPSLSDLTHRPKHIMVSHLEKDKGKNAYTCFALDHYINDINEKTTRLIVVVYPLLKHIRDFNKQIHHVLKTSHKTVPAIDLNDHAQMLLGQIELFFYLLHSALDLYAKLSSVFNQSAPEKFGKQLYDSFERKRIWDHKYQQFLQKQKEFKSWLNKYRNELAHEFSLKIRFLKINRSWRTAISSDYYSVEGLVVPDALEILWRKYLNFSEHFDRYFFKKQSNLSIFVSDNNVC